MLNLSMWSEIRSKGENQSSILLRVTLRKSAFTKLAFDSPIRLRATSTVAATAA